LKNNPVYKLKTFHWRLGFHGTRFRN